jgi:hypothetical protein
MRGRVAAAELLQSGCSWAGTCDGSQMFTPERVQPRHRPTPRPSSVAAALQVRWHCVAASSVC